MGSVLSFIARLWVQSFFIPKPPITEANCPDQTGKVHIVTGGYAGCGLHLSKILYGANATVFVAGRSKEKAARAIELAKTNAPHSKGSIHFLYLDLADLTTIKPAVAEFTSKSDRLDVLTLNAGVMGPPRGSKTAQGEELTMGTNCLGPWLLYSLLKPLLSETAKRPNTNPGQVRVTWAGSMGTDFLAPRHGLILTKDDTGLERPIVSSLITTNYAMSKVGNIFCSSEGAKRDAQLGIVHNCWNPGNLGSELYRHTGPLQFLTSLFLFAPVYGAYTELYAAVSPEFTPSMSGSYIYPWGRPGSNRADVALSLKSKSEGGTGYAEIFVAYCERATAAFA